MTSRKRSGHTFTCSSACTHGRIAPPAATAGVNHGELTALAAESALNTSGKSLKSTLLRYRHGQQLRCGGKMLKDKLHTTRS